MIEFLVDVLQADTQVKSNSGLSVLHVAAQTDSPVSVVYFTKAKGIQIDEQDLASRTPLHWAIHHKSKLCLEYILALQENLELKDSDGRTALHKAISLLWDENSVFFVRSLTLRGSSISAKTDTGESCLDLIPRNEISKELAGQANWLLRKHFFSCQFTLTFRFLPRKFKRSWLTMVAWLLTMLSLQYFHITIILPSK